MAVRGAYSTGPQRQRGAALLIGIAVAGAIVMSIVVGWSLWITKEAEGAREQQRATYLAEVTTALQEWYARDAATIDTNAGAYTENEILSMAAPLRQYGIRAASSVRLGLPCANPSSGSCVAYHVFVVWFPPESDIDTSAINQATGVFTPATAQVQYSVVSGQLIQGTKVAESTATMNGIAVKLQQFFTTRSLADVSAHATQNYFRAVSCGAPQPGELPCVDSYTSGAGTGVPGAAGVDTTRFLNAWGGAIELSNLQDSQTTSAPYSMAIRTTTPWGSTLSIKAVQPM